MAERITAKDVRRAVARHAVCLDRCGITYTGRLTLQEAPSWRLGLTDLPKPGHAVTPETLGDLREGKPFACSCGASGIAGPARWEHVSSAEQRPPIGDDYLGRTARAAYDAIVERTGIIYDAHHALKGSDSKPAPSDCTR